MKLVILDLDCFLYPYSKTYRNTVLRAWREIKKEYGLPIFRRKTAQKLIEEAKEEANKNPDDVLCRSISQLAGGLECEGFPRASVLGMLEVYYRRRNATQLTEEEEDTDPGHALDRTYRDPPYKEMIALAYNLRLLQDRKSGKKARFAPDKLQEKIVEGDKGITQLWNRRMGTGFIRPDAELASAISRLANAGVEVALLTHSFKQGEGEAMQKLEKLGLGGVIPEPNIFGIEEISPYRKGAKPEVYEKVLAAINNSRDPADAIKPIETIMAEDTPGNLEGAKKAGMQTVWVPRKEKHIPGRSSPKRRKELASVDHIFATPHQFLDALLSAIRASSEEARHRRYQD